MHIRTIKQFLFNNKTIRQTVMKNTIWLFSGEVLSRILKMFLVVYAARILGVSGWGTFSYIVAIATFFMTFSDMGLSSLVTREMAQDQDLKLKYLSTAFYLKLTLLVLTFIILIVFAPIFIKTENTRLLILPISLFLIFESLTQFGVAINRAFEKMEKEALIKILSGFSISGAGILFLLYSPTPKSLAIAYMLGSAIGLIGIIILLRKIIKPLLLGFKKDLVGQILNAAWPLIILGLFGTFLTVDTIMLGWWKSAVDVGLYSVSQKLTQFIGILPTFLGIATFPVFSKLATKNPSKLKEIFEQTSIFLLLVAIPIVAGVFIFGKEIILYIFGQDYIAASLSFTIFSLTIPLSFLNTGMINIIFVNDKQKEVVPIMLGTTILNIVLNIVLIPQYGIIGAAFAALVSYMYMTVLFWKKIKQIIPFSIIPGLKKIIMATLGMSCLALLFRFLTLPILISVSFSIISYFGILWTLKEPILRKIPGLFKL